MSNGPAEKSLPAPALARGLAILEQLAATRKGLTNAELARRLGLAKSTTHHLLATLEATGYVGRPDEAGRYFISSRLVDLGSTALGGIRLRSRTAPLLRSLQERARGLAVHLAIWDQGEVVLVEKLAPRRGPRLATWVGRRMDAHCTGCGKAILAHLPAAELERHIREHGLPRHNDNSISSARKLAENLALARQAGYSVDDEEDEIGYRCTGAPIFENGQVVAALSVAGTTEDVTLDNLPHLGRLAADTARRITTLLAGGEA